MRRKTLLTALLFLCACGDRYTGLGSVDLEITSMTFRDSDPATITGILPTGKPAGFVTAAESPLVKAMSIDVGSPADTQGMAQANDQVSFPVFYSAGQNLQTDGSALITMEHSGLSWKPEYLVETRDATRRIYASAVIRNQTVQTWNTDTLNLQDPLGNSVTVASGRITIGEGSSRIPWWNAPAGEPESILRYGWPRPGRWNPLIAVYCPAAGRVENWNQGVVKSGDTLYFPADSLVSLDLTWEQQTRGYQCFLQMGSSADTVVRWSIQWPESLPRGADIEPGPGTVSLSPGETATVLYKEVY